MNQVLTQSGKRLTVPLFRRAADRGDDLGAERGSELDGGGADAAAAAMHQQPFAWLQSTALENIVPDGEHGLRQRGRLFQ